MRAYFFTNMYLSSIQQGIQPLHVVSEMFIKYPTHTQEYQILEDWARNHKTVICLNAGYSDEIRELITTFNTMENPFPWAFFKEGPDALDGALTSVGIVLPEEIYGAAKEIKDSGGWVLALSNPYAVNTKKIEGNAWLCSLAERINQYGLAK